jgi:hypothetical protein
MSRVQYDTYSAAAPNTKFVQLAFLDTLTTTIRFDTLLPPNDHYLLSPRCLRFSSWFYHVELPVISLSNGSTVA